MASQKLALVVGILSIAVLGSAVGSTNIDEKQQMDDEGMRQEVSDQLGGTDAPESATKRERSGSGRATDIFGFDKKPSPQTRSGFLGLSANTQNCKSGGTGRINCSEVDLLTMLYFQRFVRAAITWSADENQGLQSEPKSVIVRLDDNYARKLRNFAAFKVSNATQNELTTILDETVSTLEKVLQNAASLKSGSNNGFWTQWSPRDWFAFAYRFDKVLLPVIPLAFVAIFVLAARISKKMNLRSLVRVTFVWIVLAFILSVLINYCRLVVDERSKLLAAIENLGANCAASNDRAPKGNILVSTWHRLKLWVTDEASECERYWLAANGEPFLLVTPWHALVSTFGESSYVLEPMGKALHEFYSGFVLQFSFFERFFVIGSLAFFALAWAVLLFGVQFRVPGCSLSIGGVCRRLRVDNQTRVAPAYEAAALPAPAKPKALQSNSQPLLLQSASSTAHQTSDNGDNENEVSQVSQTATVQNSRNSSRKKSARSNKTDKHNESNVQNADQSVDTDEAVVQQEPVRRVLSRRKVIPPASTKDDGESERNN